MSTSVQEPGDRKYRALSGLSMGGGRSLNIGFSHINAFAYVGGFSSAPNTNEFGGLSDTKLLPDLMAARIPARILVAELWRKGWADQYQPAGAPAPGRTGVPHVWHVDGNAHDDTEWAYNLYLLSSTFSGERDLAIKSLHSQLAVFNPASFF